MLANRQLLAAVMMVGVLVVVGGPAQAASITIPNFSFESPVVGPGAWAPGADDWGLWAGAFGRFHGNGDFGQDAAPTDGNQMAFFGLTPSTQADVRQELSDTYAPGQFYSLSVDIAMRGPYVGDDYSMDMILFADGDPNDILASRRVTPADLVADVFKTVTLVATPGEVSGALGQTIGVRFVSLTSSPGDFDLDNVGLEAYVPEPSSLMLAALGLLSVASFGRYRRFYCRK